MPTLGSQAVANRPATVSPTTTLPLLRPYQLQTIAWLKATTALNNPNRFVVLDPGLGKTAIAIKAARAVDAQNVLVICPAVARLVWVAELAKWWGATPPPNLLVIEPGVRPTARQIPRPGWTIIAYSNLSLTDDPWLSRLAALDWDLLIIDECQYLKGHSNRTHATYGRRLDGAPGSLAGAAERVWLLSGTPAPNHAGELYPHLRALFSQALPPSVRNEIDFEDRYCRVLDTQWGRRIAGSNLATLPDLRARLQPHIIRRRREDVLHDLPALSYYDTPIDAELRDIDTSKFPTLPNASADDDLLVRNLRAGEIHLVTERRLMGERKAPAAASFCEEILSELPLGHQKIVVFAYHRSVIAALAVALRDWEPVVVDGSTPPGARDQAIRSFTRDHERHHAFIGQIQAAGVAISLTAAHVAVFVECSWVPSENYQAALRIHRLGQRDACTIHFLYVPQSIDQRVMRVFRRKAGELTELLKT